MALDAGGFPQAGTPVLVAPDQSISLPGAVAVAGVATFASVPVVPAGGSGKPGIQIGATAYGVANFAGTELTLIANGANALRLQTTIAAFNVPIGVGFNTIWSSPSSAVWQAGAAGAAAPVSYTLQGQGARAGTDNNTGGASLTVRAGAGTGTGTLSSLIFQTPVAVASGTGAQTMTTGLTIKNGVAISPVYTVATLPTASTVPYGRCFVSDALTTLTLGIGTTVAGGGANKTPVWSDGTNWIYG